MSHSSVIKRFTTIRGSCFREMPDCLMDERLLDVQVGRARQNSNAVDMTSGAGTVATNPNWALPCVRRAGSQLLSTTCPSSDMERRPSTYCLVTSTCPLFKYHHYQSGKTLSSSLHSLSLTTLSLRSQIIQPHQQTLALSHNRHGI